MTTQKNHSFAVLFKKFRLRSEIETLAQFGDLLAQEGLIYEDSLFTRWQKGERIPKDRKILLKIIELFVKRGGMNNSEEANKLLAAGQMRDLNEAEKLIVGLKERQMDSNVTNPDITYGQAVKLILNGLLRSKYFYWISFLFVLITIWHVRVWTLRLYNSAETDYLGNVYGLIALSSGFYIFFSNKNKTTGSRFNNITTFLSLGLLSQWAGLIIWSYYTIFLKVEVPYPSFADLGYFGLIPCYILAAIQLIDNEKYSIRNIFLNRRYAILFMPILILLVSYSIFLQRAGFDLFRQSKVVLNAVYPLGEIIPILIVLYLIVSPRSKLDTLTRTRYIFLVFAFFMQFVAEYSFIYSAQIGAYVNGGIDDYLYATSYFIMNLVIISFMNSYIFNYVISIKKTTKTARNKFNSFLSAIPFIFNETK